MRDWIHIQPTDTRPSMKRLAQAVAESQGMTLEDLMIPTRGNNNSRASVRALAMSAIRAQLGYSYPRIGQFFGGMDHTTVLYAIARANGGPKKTSVRRALAKQEAA